MRGLRNRWSGRDRNRWNVRVVDRWNVRVMKSVECEGLWNRWNVRGCGIVGM
jgi:hypothetical protein